VTRSYSPRNADNRKHVTVDAVIERYVFREALLRLAKLVAKTELKLGQ
jgi:hypothetical protein